ncbi:MAG: Uncharacterised protein [Candidatus Poseidoniaceae archaeon]|nr:MAG: Uncharacterised protein [Candidatus Poseidoniaceae archaeon]
METGVRFRDVLVLVLVAGMFLGSTNATASDEMFFNNIIEISNPDNGKRTIEADSSGNIFASFGTVLYKLSHSGTILEERTFSKEIIATSISPDSTKLALTLKSGSNGQDSIFVLSTGDLSTLAASDITQTNAYILEWSPNGGVLFSNAPTSGIIQLNRDTLEVEVNYEGNHTGAMTCVDVSSISGMVFTADENGLMHLWDEEGAVLQEIQVQSTALDCAFGNDDAYYSISTPTDGIRKWTLSGSELKPVDINGANNYQFTENQNEVIALKTTPNPHIIVYDYLNEMILDNITMFHSFDDYVLQSNEIEGLTNILTNSRIDSIVIYGTSIQRIGIGESGTDTDGDGIPDSLDNDDDGDGIEDKWDLNCADVGISCELLPDENFIRSIDLNLNDTSIVVQQTFTLNKATSASIRDLSRLSLDTDVRLSSDEAQLFADSVCFNIDLGTVTTTIAEMVSIENATLNFLKMECAVENGMTLVPSNDRTSHIRYSISLTYDLNTNTSLDDMQVQVENHRFPAAGSMTELSDQHPIRVTIAGPSIITQEYVPWHVQELQITLDVKAVEVDGENLSPTSILSSPIVIAFVLAGIFVIGFVAQRLYDRMSQSDYDIVLDDDEEHLTEDEENEAYFVEDTFQDEIEDMVSKPEKRRPPRKSVEKTSKRVPVQSKEATQAKELLQQSSNEVVRKRRARRSEHDTVTSKRRKLSDSQPIDAKPRKRRAVKRNASKDDEMDES